MKEVYLLKSVYYDSDNDIQYGLDNITAFEKLDDAVKEGEDLLRMKVNKLKRNRIPFKQEIRNLNTKNIIKIFIVEETLFTYVITLLKVDVK